MLREFSAASHKVFITAYERELEGALPDSFQDKPLRYLALNLRQGPLDQTQTVISEELNITMLSVDEAESLPYNYTCARYPEELLNRYVEVSKAVAQVALSDTLVIADTLPVEGIDANYVLTYANGKSRHISSFKEKPSKQSIASGAYFAQEAQQYVESNKLFRTPSQNVAQRLMDIARNGKTEDTRIMSHRFEFAITPDLPLNGYESRQFLEHYANTMFAKSMRHGERAAIMQARGANAFIYEHEQTLYDKHDSAYRRAQALLDKK
jgi:hypothetical protein